MEVSWVSCMSYGSMAVGWGPGPYLANDITMDQ
jgi:hypothetical protein